ncbi:MAG TPA: PaaI family thioesterase [Acidimicrobiia bacterium]|jgi:acyl-coenzyme A thioesterase PaaI-like protein|nr:PaaI family thioesterase [Acidimicrobiia bacterium]
MSTEDARLDAAAALRDLNHVFTAHDADEDVLAALARDIRVQVATLETAPMRDRLALMRSRRGESPFMAGSGFEDRAVGGRANPGAVDLYVRFEPEAVVADVTFRKAFEGAPGRAHGGIVAAAFDDVTGFVIGQLQEPSFTGELTVRYIAPVPVDTPLEMRARLVGRERRKLFIEAELHDRNTLVATCKAIYIKVDPSKFAGFPDPR